MNNHKFAELSASDPNWRVKLEELLRQGIAVHLVGFKDHHLNWCEDLQKKYGAGGRFKPETGEAFFFRP